MVRPTLLARSFDLVGPCGTERIKILKNAFKSILNNALPVDFKVILQCVRTNSIDEMVQIAQQSFSTSPKGGESKYVAKSDKLTVADLIQLPNYRKEFVEKWPELLPETKQLLFNVAEVLRDIIRNRNSLFRGLRKVHQVLEVVWMIGQ